MKLFLLPGANIRHSALSSLLAVILIASGVAVISLVISIKTQLTENALNNLNRIDMVVGAKGSPLQLILANVYHVDHPTGNIPLSETIRVTKNPLVRSAVKISYGDFYDKYRILGADTAFFGLYELELSSGKIYQKNHEAVVGSEVAEKLGLKTGSTFHGSHGGTDGEEHHDDYMVTGVLKKSGTVADQLVITSLSTVWAEHHIADTGNREITAMLVRFRTPMGLLTLPRMINQSTSMQAALPSVEVNRLITLMGSDVQVIFVLAAVILVLSATGIFITLLNALKQRRYELALLRVMGARPSQLFGLILLESVYLGLIGWFTGFVISRVLLWLITKLWTSGYNFVPDIFAINSAELLLMPMVTGLCMIAAILPAIRAYRTPISKTLLND